MSNKVTETLQNLRKNYTHAALDIGDCDPEPTSQFSRWLQNAVDAECDEPNAFVLSTCENGRPHARVVLLKGLENGLLYFYTNYQSAKGKELRASDAVALTFLWLPLQRQVRIEGKVRLATPEESDAYFRRRPRGSQLGAAASPQSERMRDRKELEERFRKTEEKYHGKDSIPRPPHWGGYVVEPGYFEFWQGRENRMHDRISYERKENSWVRFRLAP